MAAEVNFPYLVSDAENRQVHPPLARRTNRCRVCGALKDEEFIRRAFADRERVMAAVSQYETPR